MKFTNSIYTPNMSGKQGNVVFSSNQYGIYSCQRRIPVDPRTEDQQTVRAGTSSIAKAWATLTPAQRTNWRDVAHYYPFQKKGKKYFLIGFTFFMKLNRNLYEVNEPLMRVFPINKPNAPQVFSSYSVKLVDTPAGKDLLLFINPSIENYTKIKLSATMHLKDTELYGKHIPHKIAVLDSSFVSGSSIKDFYIKKYFRLPSLMEKVFFDIQSTNIKSGFTTIPRTSEVFGI